MAEQSSNFGWRDYWQENRLAACVPDNPDSAAEIQAHWTEFFGGLPATARVLDVATGNGVLIVWAARATRAAGHQLALTGVDLADINPVNFLPEYREDLAQAHFIGNTAAESLPLKDSSVDVVVSQYGLEYADLQRALSEAARVLVPGGQLHWLAHGDNSIVVAQGRQQLKDIDVLLASKGPFTEMKAFIEACATGYKVKRATKQLTEALRKAEAYCTANPGATLVRQLCGGILDTANNFEKYRPEDARRWLEENRQRLRSQRQRIRDLQAARLSEERLAQLQLALSTGPWTEPVITSLDVNAGSDSVGLLIHATRR
ncbi:MAG: ubiquinone/menaquinone biosynthesis C-methylase UbiE [Glaciecola sp.]|jgi:ubiquinone/menaquinone biosynthesis C-methylase UbiE